MRISSMGQIIRTGWIWILLLSLVLPNGVNSDQGQASKSKLLSLLERFPAQDSEERDRLALDLIGLGQGAILEICRMLLPPGSGDDTHVRFALSAVTTTLARGALEKDRWMVAKALIEALEKEKDQEVQAFLIRQLQRTGKNEAVKPLLKYIRDERLGEPAVQALLAIGTSSAEKALLKSLNSSTGRNRISIVRALGELRSKGATKKILEYAASQDSQLRQVALFALANIGDPKAESFLKNVSLEAPSYERAKAPALYLLYAQRLAESGQKAECERICRTLITSYTAPQESHVPCTAMSILVDNLGEKAFADLLQAMDSPNRELRMRALELSDKIPGEKATAEWIEKMENSRPDVQAQIITMLGKRGDKTALPILTDKLKSHKKDVRLASISSVVRLGGSEVLEDLTPLLYSEDADEIAAVQRALRLFPGNMVIPRAVRLITEVPPLSKVALIEILSERKAREQVDVLFSMTKNEDDQVRRAALEGLESLVTEEALPRLIGMLLKETESRNIRFLQNAVVAASNQIKEKERRAELLLKALETADKDKQTVLLRPLSRIGGQEALRAVVNRTKNEDSRIQTFAISVLSEWPEWDAADELFEICQKTEDQKHLLLAVQGYTRLINESALDPEEKLGKSQELLNSVSDSAAKAIVLTGFANIKSIEAFRLAASYLDENELRSRAAATVARIAFSGINLAREISKPDLFSIVHKASSFVEDHSLRHRLDASIGDMLKEEGFDMLFNGKNLSGWKGLVADPVRRAQMSPKELKKAQARADEVMRAHWEVVDGILVFDGKGESLCTVKDYGDFELLVDWKIVEGGDSGIYLRGSPQVQIWDPANQGIGSGGLYNNQIGPSKPFKRADNPVGEWNTFRIRMVGEQVTVYLNGVLVVDDVVMENYWERDKPIYASGQIELQAHGNPLYFRNIYIREISRSDGGQELTKKEIQEGFVSLFNGKDLTGWIGDKKGYVAENGKIVVYPQRGSGNLYTEKEYGDFILRFEFKLTPEANNGLAIRAPLEGNAAYEGMEIQILDNTAELYKNLEPYQYHGSIYGVVPAKRGHLKPVGEWNQEEVTAQGKRVIVILNAVTIVDGDIAETGTPQTLDGRDHPGLKREKGHIGFLGHGYRVEFRNLRIKELKEP
jgi:HEAT repeat protein